MQHYFQGLCQQAARPWQTPDPFATPDLYIPLLQLDSPIFFPHSRSAIASNMLENNSRDALPWRDRFLILDVWGALLSLIILTLGTSVLSTGAGWRVQRHRCLIANLGVIESSYWQGVDTGYCLYYGSLDSWIMWGEPWEWKKGRRGAIFFQSCKVLVFYLYYPVLYYLYTMGTSFRTGNRLASSWLTRTKQLQGLKQRRIRHRDFW